MNNVVELVDLEKEIQTREVHYYTVRFLDQDLSEFEKFIEKHSANEDIKEEFYDLLAWIKEKLGKRSAEKRYFRPERKAEALPPKAKYLEMQYEQQLRLYVIRITDHIVILLNGGIKTTRYAQDCPNVSRHFRFANKVAGKIDEQFAEKNLQLSEDLKDLIKEKRFEIRL